MDTVRLGRTDLQVTPICFGTWQLSGDWGDPEAEGARQAIRRARELGVNFFDTAQGYGWGAAERLLGEELRAERDEVVLATKGGLRVTEDGLVRDSSPAWLRQGVEESLQALGVDHIDLYQVHWPDEDTPFEETGQALADLVAEGKIRHVGVSNFDARQMAALEETLPVETLQPPYHLFRRDIEDDVLPWCAEHDVGVLVYGPLAHGLLTGAFDEDHEFSRDDWRAGSDLFAGEAFHTNLDKVRALGDMAGERGHTVSQLAIAWALSHPAVQVAIVGARKAHHFEESAGAADIRLDDDDRARIDRIMAGAVPVGGPSPEM